MTASSDVEVADDGRPMAEGEIALWDAFKSNGSLAARERLFSHYAAFAGNVARRHHRERSWGDIELNDLHQYAYAGLLEALDRFDPSQGTPFRPFAVHRISGSIQDGITHMNELREQLSWRHRMRRERLQSLAERASDEKETAATPIEKLAELAMGLALGFMLEGTGLFAEPGGESDGPGPTGTAYDSLAWKEVVVQLHANLSELPEREQTILRQHYLHGVNFDQLASLLAITKGRVSQLHRAALLTLRKRLREHGHFRMIR